MAKIENNNNAKKNTNRQPVGTMSKEKLSRFKLTGNVENPGEYKVRSQADSKIVARNIRALHSYRMYVHKCIEPKLPSSLKRSVHYFLTPMSRSDSDNSKDRKGFVVENTDNNSAEASN